MRAIRKVIVLALTGLVGIVSIDAASAHHVRRHRIVRHFVFPTQGDAAAASGPGNFGGMFETGILGASTADPDTQPGYRYDGHGYYGPGFGYPGY